MFLHFIAVLVINSSSVYNFAKIIIIIIKVLNLVTNGTKKKTNGHFFLTNYTQNWIIQVKFVTSGLVLQPRLI